MHLHDEAMLSSQLQLWLKQGVIEPCESQWNSALIAVAKCDQSLKRFCIDFRPLNKKCKHLSICQGSINTNMDHLHGSILYSAFNMLSSFMAIPLVKSLHQFFAFTMPTRKPSHYLFFPSAGLIILRSMQDLCQDWYQPCQFCFQCFGSRYKQ